MITTDRLILRQWVDADRDAWAALNADPTVMEFFPAPLDREQSDAACTTLQQRISDHGFGFWAAELRSTGAFVGMIGLADRPEGLPISPCIEVGWRLHQAFWGKGLATEGARASLDYAFGVLSRDEVVAFTATANVRSYRVMERLGMVRDVATFDHPSVPVGSPLREHLVYRITRTQWLHPPESGGLA